MCVDIAMAKYHGKSPEILKVLLVKKEKNLRWGKKTNMIGSGGIFELEIEIQALKKLLKKN